MGGLTDTDDIRMTNLDTEEQFTKQVEENDPVEETIAMEVDTIIDESEDIESPTPARDLIPEIQVIPVECLTSTAHSPGKLISGTFVLAYSHFFGLYWVRSGPDSEWRDGRCK